MVNAKKSVMVPGQSLEFLGFVIKSQRMEISFSLKKLKSIRKLAKEIHQQPNCSAWTMAQPLGMMVTTHLAVLPAPLHYHHPERAKTRTLQHGQDYEAQLQVNQKVHEELTWWIREAAQHNGRSLCITHWDLTVDMNAFTMG